MVNEVNKLIFNTLISCGAISLPDVGTLFLERQSAKFVSRDRVVSPRLCVSFSSQRDAISLVDIISREAQVDAAAAADIYTRWLDKVRTSNCVDIQGVGKLVNRSFIPDAALLEQLNPVDVGEVKISRRHSKVGVFAIVVLMLLIVAANFLRHSNSEPAIEVQEQGSAVVEEVVVEQPAEVIPEELSDVEIEDVEHNADWRSSDDIRHWVVIGSYSTTDNVERAIASLQGEYPDLHFDYIKLGSMYAVSPFGSSDRVDCEVFKREYEREFPQMWIHTPKRFKE